MIFSEYKIRFHQLNHEPPTLMYKKKLTTNKPFPKWF